MPTSAPLETACNPRGTVMSTAYVALSLGWSLTGNHDAATCGSPITTAPSEVGKTPPGTCASSSMTSGMPW